MSKLERPRPPADEAETKKVDAVFRIQAQTFAWRSTFGAHWEEAANIVLPNYRNTFYAPGSYNFPGVKKADRQVDASGMVANQKFAAICDSMLTPFSAKWHNLEATDSTLQRNRQVRLWFETVSEIMHRTRYAAASNFRKQNQAIFQQVGVFGNGPMFVDQLYDMFGQPQRGWRYKSLPLGQVYIRVNFQGQVDAFLRAWRMTARQAMQQFGHDMLPDALDAAQDLDSEQPFDFFHCVYPNTDYDPEAKVTVNAKKWISHYVSVTGRRLMQEGGYYSFPLPFCRYMEWPDDYGYGRGWAMDALPALKTLNAQKSTQLKIGHRSADPVFLIGDDGLTDFDWTPGAQNVGGVTPDGKPLVHTVPPGDYKASVEMMQEERNLIGELSMVTIFQKLVENPNMTATQVIELINQKGIFLAPGIGGMTEYLDVMIERELEMGIRMKLFPPMPPILQQAKGEYKIEYTSPLFKASRAGEASGFLRTVESAMEVAGQMQDSSILDNFEFDVALPEIARIQDVPESWMASPESIQKKRQSRAQAQQQQQQVQALPAQAAMLKAQAMVNKRTGGSFPGGIQQEAPQ